MTEEPNTKTVTDQTALKVNATFTTLALVVPGHDRTTRLQTTTNYTPMGKTSTKRRRLDQELTARNSNWLTLLQLELTSRACAAAVIADDRVFMTEVA